MAEINWWWKVEAKLSELGILDRSREKWGKKLNDNELKKAEALIAEKLEVGKGFSTITLPMKYTHFGYQYGERAWYGYGAWRYSVLHPGTDFNRGAPTADLGDPVFAMADGVVTYKGWASGFGWHMFIIHEVNHKKYGRIKCWSHHMHLRDNPGIAVGDAVKVGQTVARVGKTGTTIPHLHFEIRRRPLGILFWSELKGKDRAWLDERFYSPETFFD